MWWGGWGGLETMRRAPRITCLLSCVGPTSSPIYPSHLPLNSTLLAWLPSTLAPLPLDSSRLLSSCLSPPFSISLSPRSSRTLHETEQDPGAEINPGSEMMDSAQQQVPHPDRFYLSSPAASFLFGKKKRKDLSRLSSLITLAGWFR